MKLFHVSEDYNIAKFIPRYSLHTETSVIWAIADSKLANYLLPRDCPRVCFYASNKTSAAERQQFLGSSQQVIAIESAWYEKTITTTLYLYEMPGFAFKLFDSIAGYYVADSIVFPLRQHIINNPIRELLARNVELRILPSLWQLHDAVANSTLNFSMIRMKNAQAKQSP